MARVGKAVAALLAVLAIEDIITAGREEGNNHSRGDKGSWRGIKSLIKVGTVSVLRTSDTIS